MQRSRRRKLREEARRNPFLLQAVKHRDATNHALQGRLNRATRRQLMAQLEKESK